MDERPDPLFRKYFYWSTHKDAKGTPKTNNVLVTNRQTSLPVARSRIPIKKKVVRTPKVIKTHPVSDEDFFLLQSFLSEIKAIDKPAEKAVIRHQVTFTT